MHKKLLIVESPSKAKTIGKYVGSDYIVKASVGHIRDLPKSNKDAIDIEGGFIPRYVVPEEKKKVVFELAKIARDASEIILATDPDREGEAIAWHIYETLELEGGKKNPAKPVHRIVFHEITEKAVKEALLHPRDIDDKLVKAQEARRVLDRLVGYDLSGLIWKKVRYGLSAGRVQSPALRILVEREREIKAFIPEQYWQVHATLNTPRKVTIAFECETKPKTEKEADAIVAAGQKNDWTIQDIEESEMARKARAPFTTSTLQQTASSRLGLSPSMAMRLAQKLYEAGHITYMRTDSTSMSEDARAEIAKVVTSTYGAEFSEPQTYKTKSKNAQEAHEGIRPTHVSAKTAGNSEGEQRLYDLIWRRAVSSQMKDAKILKTKITAAMADSTMPLFTVTGSRTLFKGWLMADPEAKGEDVELPEAKKGEPLKLEEIHHTAHETEPPHRYSEAGLVKELEKRGIGRPSTYASIIQTIVGRKYVDKIDRSLKPTDTGEVVSSFLEQHFGNIISDTFTAQMEENLDDIANGEKEYEKTLKDFYGPFQKELKAGDKASVKITNLGPAPEGMKCPDCGGDMIIKLGRNGKFLSCAKFPECEGARTIEGAEIAKPKETGEDCPECKKGKLIEREGRFGKFISCNRYPKCKFIKKDEAAEKEREAKMSTGVHCPKCETGVITERRGKYGAFFSCNNYPTCDFNMKSRPTGDKCEICSSLMMEGTKTIPVRCSNKSCENHTPNKKK